MVATTGGKETCLLDTSRYPRKFHTRVFEGRARHALSQDTVKNSCEMLCGILISHVWYRWTEARIASVKS